MAGGRLWTAAEDQIITAAAGSGAGAEGAQARLKGRALASIRMRAVKLGVKFGRTKKPRKPRPAPPQPIPRPLPDNADPRLRLEAICRDPELLGRFLADLTARATAVWLALVERQVEAGDARCLPTLMALGPATARLSTSVLAVAEAAAGAQADSPEESTPPDVNLDAFKIRPAA